MPRGSQPSAELRYPPDGAPLVLIQYVRWEFFTKKGKPTWNDLYFSEEDAERLCRQLDEALGFVVSGN